MAFIQNPAPPYNTPLAGGASATSQWYNNATGQSNYVSVSVYADQPGLLQIQTTSTINASGSNVSSAVTIAQVIVPAGTTTTLTAYTLNYNYYRWSYQNTSSTTNVILSIASFTVADPATAVLASILQQLQILNANFLAYAATAGVIDFEGTDLVPLE
jgi:hypothetical protein